MPKKAYGNKIDVGSFPKVAKKFDEKHNVGKQLTEFERKNGSVTDPFRHIKNHVKRR